MAPELLILPIPPLFIWIFGKGNLPSGYSWNRNINARKSVWNPTIPIPTFIFGSFLPHTWHLEDSMLCFPRECGAGHGLASTGMGMGVGKTPAGQPRLQAGGEGWEAGKGPGGFIPEKRRLQGSQFPDRTVQPGAGQDWSSFPSKGLRIFP